MLISENYISYNLLTNIRQDKQFPVITVITPFFNNLNIIDTINSVLEQDYCNIEYIIADDCSENSISIIEQVDVILKRKSFNNLLSVRVHRQKQNIGTVKNLNDAIRQAKGEYIFILSADDMFYSRQVLNRWTEFFLKEQALVCTAKRIICKNTVDNVQCIRPLNRQIKKIKEKSSHELYQTIKYENYIFGCCTAYNKKCFEQYGYFDETYKLLEDHPMVLHLLKNNVSIKFWDAIAIYQMTGGISSLERVNPIFECDVERLLRNEAIHNREDPNLLVCMHKKYKKRLKTFYELWNARQYRKALRFDPFRTLKESMKPIRSILVKWFLLFRRG